MIKMTVKEASLRAGLTTAYQLQKAADISPAVAADLWEGKMARLSTLDLLCDVLGCDLPDLVRRSGRTKPRPQKRPKLPSKNGRLASRKNGKHDLRNG